MLVYGLMRNFLRKSHALFSTVLPLLLAVTVALVLIGLVFPNGDTFFIIATGQHIVENGSVPTINPFVIHEEFNMIIQQWLFDIMIYGLYDFAGYLGVYLYSAVILLVTLFMMYRYFGIYSDNTRLKLLTLAFWGIFATYFVVARPTSISFLMCLSVVMIMEEYRRSQKRRWLCLLPALSLLTINMHAAMWPMLFVLIIPFIFPNSLPARGQFRRYCREWLKKWKWVLVAMLGMFLAGFLNPNGIRGMGYLFLSYGSASSNNVITELQRPEIMSLPGGMILATLLFLFKYIDKHRAKMDFSIFYMAAGTVILAMMHFRNAWFLFFGMTPLFFHFFNGLRWKPAKELKSTLAYVWANVRHVLVTLLLLAIVVVFGSPMVADSSKAPVEAVAYLDLLEKDNVTLYTEFDNGAYMELNGYKVYMDARPELFQEKVNGREDVYSEYLQVLNGTIDFDEFLDKYQFSHLIVFDGTALSAHLRATDGYDMVVDGNGYTLFERQVVNQ